MLLQTVWFFKENLYFAKSGINETFMGPKMKKFVLNASLNMFNRFYRNFGKLTL